MQFKACRGLEDLLPAETATWQQVEHAARDTAHTLGYREIRTPLLEASELFETGGHPREIFARDVLQIKDRAGVTAALRPELTSGILRAYVENKIYQAPQKFHQCAYLGPVAWSERLPQPHLVEDEQFGVEAIGSPSPAVDADVMGVAVTFIKAIGIKKPVLKVSFRGCSLCLPLYAEMLNDFVAESTHQICPDCREHLLTDPLYLLSCPEPGCRSLTRIMPTLYVSLCPECRYHFQAVQDDLHTMGIDFSVSPLLTCNPSYYTRTIFSVFAPGDDGLLLASGGRYDTLIEMLGGPSTPAVGFAARIGHCVRSLEAAGVPVEDGPVPDIVIACTGEEADRAVLKTVMYLRQRHVRVERDYDNRTLKAQLRYAGRVGARYLIVLGDEEMRHNAIPVRDLNRNTQEFLPTSRLGEALFQYLRSTPRARQPAAV